MPIPDTLSQAREQFGSIQADVPESAKRHFRAKAAELGKSNAEYLLYLLETFTGYEPSKPTDNA